MRRSVGNTCECVEKVTTCLLYLEDCGKVNLLGLRHILELLHIAHALVPKRRQRCAAGLGEDKLQGGGLLII